MMLSTECNGSINLRSMVWPISVITLASWLEALSGDRYVKAEPAIDSLLERYPTGSKAPLGPGTEARSVRLRTRLPSASVENVAERIVTSDTDNPPAAGEIV